MTLTDKQQSLLKSLPGVDHVLEKAKCDAELQALPKSIVVQSIREVIDDYRNAIRGNTPSVQTDDLSDDVFLDRVRQRANRLAAPNLVPVVNATGVVVHTNLGRSLLAREALENLSAVGGRYSNLEYNLAAGRRGLRYSAVEDLLCEICGAEAAMVVNNNAGAVFLSLETLARGKSVVVSRGELVEIGGSFRIPDVMARSGACLREVGTTNRTHARDYREAVDDSTGLLLKVHQSNFSIVGFTAAVSLAELVAIGREHDIPVMEDLGSGTFIDFSQFGLLKEPTVQESVGAGVDVVTFSGDKLLGGPQAGVIVGRRRYIEQIQKNPVNRALRIDKLTLAALESTLRLYRDPQTAVQAIPTLKMLTCPPAVLEQKAERLAGMLQPLDPERLQIVKQAGISRAGGGSLPLLELPTCCLAVSVRGMTAHQLEKRLRAGRPPIIGRIEDDRFIMDPRTLQTNDFPLITAAFQHILEDL